MVVNINQMIVTEIIKTQDKMADRIAEVIKRYESDLSVDIATLTSKLLKLFEDITNDMNIAAIEFSTPKTSEGDMPKKFTSITENLVFIAKLNKGYIKFVNNTTPKAIEEMMKKETVEKELEAELGITNGKDAIEGEIASVESLVKPEGL